ncbi:unnamed protein product, partial [Brassica rapa subsp. trilocularis]
HGPKISRNLITVGYYASLSLCREEQDTIMCLSRYASPPLYLRLSLSPTYLEASREIKLRNIIALEQCHYPK